MEKISRFIRRSKSFIRRKYLNQMEFGNFLRHRRKHHLGATLRVVSDKAGKTQPELSNFENGKLVASKETLPRLAEAYDFDLKEVVYLPRKPSNRFLALVAAPVVIFMFFVIAKQVSQFFSANNVVLLSSKVDRVTPPDFLSTLDELQLPLQIYIFQSATLRDALLLGQWSGRSKITDLEYAAVSMQRFEAELGEDVALLRDISTMNSLSEVPSEDLLGLGFGVVEVEQMRERHAFGKFAVDSKLTALVAALSTAQQVISMYRSPMGCDFLVSLSIENNSKNDLLIAGATALVDSQPFELNVLSEPEFSSPYEAVPVTGSYVNPLILRHQSIEVRSFFLSFENTELGCESSDIDVEFFGVSNEVLFDFDVSLPLDGH